MAESVYILCLLTSALCAALLLKNYVKTRVRLLLWTGICFVGMTINNVFLVCDLVVFPNIDLSFWRVFPSVVGLGVLLYGFIWDSV